MITQQQYQEAKRIVDEYERDEFERNMRQAEEELDFEPAEICDWCGGENDSHYLGCPGDESPFAVLCREGYD